MEKQGVINDKNTPDFNPDIILAEEQAAAEQAEAFKQPKKRKKIAKTEDKPQPPSSPEQLFMPGAKFA